MTLSLDPDDYDEVGWMELWTGKFSAKNAYILANEWAEVDKWEGWKMIWRMKIQHWVKIFAWIMAHEKLLTNRERWQMKRAHSPAYARRAQGDERVLHAIRDCSRARGVWFYLMPSEVQIDFFFQRT